MDEIRKKSMNRKKDLSEKAYERLKWKELTYVPTLHKLKKIKKKNHCIVHKT